MGLASRAIPIFTEKDFEDGASFNVRELLTKNLAKNELVDRKGRISPSSGCALCPRQAFFTGVEPNFSKWEATSETYARIGNLLEDMIFEGLGGWGVSQNIRLWENEELKLGAAADILARDYDNRLMMLEVKSCSDLPSTPKIYQLWQLWLYIAYYKIDGMMVYFSRGIMDGKQTLKINQHEVPYDYNNAKLAIMNSYISRRSIDLVLMPPKGHLITKQADCGFCGFTNICWKSAPSKYPEMNGKELLDVIGDAQDYAEEFLSCDNVMMRRNDMWEKIKDSERCNFSNSDFHSMFRVSC